VTTDRNTLLAGLYVNIDVYLGEHTRPGRPPKLTDAGLLTLAVAQVLLGFRSEARWLRFVPRALPAAFPYLPGQSGYNKRLRSALPLIKRLIRALATDTDLRTSKNHQKNDLHASWKIDSPLTRGFGSECVSARRYAQPCGHPLRTRRNG
jgi:hypothetical protein